MKNIIVILLLTFFAVSSAAAQTTEQSVVKGVIKDPNGAVVAGARVFLTSERTAIKRTAISNASGNFAFEKLAAGDYEIRVSAQGFASQKISLTSVGGGGNGNVEIGLEVGETSVTVTAEIGQASERENVPQAVSIVDSTEIAQRATRTLSQVGREEAGLNVQQTSPTIGAIVVRGLTGKNVVNYVDGVRYTNSAQRGGINTFFNLNDQSNIQTVEVLRGPNGAQYGSDSLGGTVNLLTKSPVFGSDKAEFHGEVNPFFNSADRSFGSSILTSYGTNKLGGYVNVYGRRINTLRTANNLDSHSAITRFLGLPSSVLYDRNPDTEFTQYGGAFRLNYAPTDEQQVSFFYQRGQQDDGKRFDQLLGGDGNLIADLKNLMLDFGYLRYVKQNFGVFDTASFTASYNSQREERVNQGGQGNPSGDITHQYERTSATGASFFLDKELPARNSFLVGGDFYHEKVKSPAFSANPVTNISLLTRPRIPNKARFDSGGVFVQDAWQAIPDRLRITGALRYGGASYRVRAADSPQFALVPTRIRDDKQHFGDFSGRIGAVVRATGGLRFIVNYSRGFRYPNITDLGTLGLTGDGFEVDYTSAINLGGTIGTTAGTNAVSTGLSVAPQRSEYSNNFDGGVRYTNKRFDSEFRAFRLDINDAITKQALILPASADKQFLGDQQITVGANGVVFVPISTAPVLVRSNFTSAKIYGVESEVEARITRELLFKGNYTYIRAADKATGLPPNIEGGTPPPTGFLSLKYSPAGKKFWVEGYTTLAAKQDRLSSLDLSDRRTGAPRSRSQIANFIRRGACVRGLTVNTSGTGCGATANNPNYILLATGENISQVQTRVLGAADSNFLFTSLPSYALFNVRAGFNINEKSQFFVAFENIFDNFHRNPSWGIDGAGRNLTVQYRYKF